MSEAKDGQPQMTKMGNAAPVAHLPKYQADDFWCMAQTQMVLKRKHQTLILRDRVIVGHGSDDDTAWDARYSADRGAPMPNRSGLMVFFVPDRIDFEDPLAPFSSGSAPSWELVSFGERE